MSDPVDWKAWLVTRCRSEAESVRGVFPSIGDALDQAADALEAAEAKLAAIDALHRPDKNARCVVDWQPWPCADHRILHPEEGDQC